jgi:hypothetical protein
LTVNWGWGWEGVIPFICCQVSYDRHSHLLYSDMYLTNLNILVTFLLMLHLRSQNTLNYSYVAIFIYIMLLPKSSSRWFLFVSKVTSWTLSVMTMMFQSTSYCTYWNYFDCWIFWVKRFCYNWNFRFYEDLECETVKVCLFQICWTGFQVWNREQ